MTVPYMAPIVHKLFLIIREKPGLSRLELLNELYGDNSRHVNIISVHVNAINKTMAKVGMTITSNDGRFYLEHTGGVP